MRGDGGVVERGATAAGRVGGGKSCWADTVAENASKPARAKIATRNPGTNVGIDVTNITRAGEKVRAP
jgi:hypothetical protein